MNQCKQKVCIKVPKVYDWVQRQIDLPLISFDGIDMDDLFDKKNDDHIEVCKFLHRHPGFQVRCNLVKHSLICQEIKQHPSRHNVQIILPSGETIELQKVKVLVKGLVEIIILDKHGKILIVSDDIPFVTAQTFYLCAPKGTDLHCKVTYFQCNSDFVCTDDFEELDISILLCLDIQMETVMKLEIEGINCKPRNELAVEDVLCPVDIFPPQCPEIFPALK